MNPLHKKTRGPDVRGRQASGQSCALTDPQIMHGTIKAHSAVFTSPSSIELHLKPHVATCSGTLCGARTDAQPVVAMIRKQMMRGSTIVRLTTLSATSNHPKKTDKKVYGEREVNCKAIDKKMPKRRYIASGSPPHPTLQKSIYKSHSLHLHRLKLFLLAYPAQRLLRRMA